MRQEPQKSCEWGLPYGTIVHLVSRALNVSIVAVLHCRKLAESRGKDSGKSCC